MAMRLIIATVFVAALAPAVKADPSKPARVIEISKESAERSAAVIAAAKSPLIGMPPLGKAIRINTHADAANTKTEIMRPGIVVPRHDIAAPRSSADASDRAQIQIVRRGDTGTVVQSVVVPRQR